MGLLDRLTAGRRASNGNRDVGRVLFTAQRPPLMDVVAAPPPAPLDPAPVADAGNPPVGGTLDGMLVDQRGEPRSIIDMHQHDEGARQDAADLLSAMAAPPPPPAVDPSVPPPLPPRPAPEVEWTQAEHDEPAVFEQPADEPVVPEPEQDLLDQFAGLLDGFDEPSPRHDDAGAA